VRWTATSFTGINEPCRSFIGFADEINASMSKRIDFIKTYNEVLNESTAIN
jgi:hypothetical protein